jgi:hypothetical protein
MKPQKKTKAWYNMRMKQILSFLREHKAVIASTGIALGIVLIGWYTLLSPTTITPPSTQETSGPIEKVPEVDSDGDGMPDWVEFAYGTNPHDPDTDKDGTTDNEELSLGRNPLVAGPQDILHILSTTQTAASSTEQDPALFLNAFLSSQARTVQTSVVRELLAQFDPKEVQDRYSIKDLRVSYEISASSTKHYANTIAALFEKYRKANIESEVTLLKKALESRKASDLSKIELPALQYRDISAELRTITIPTSFAQTHLELVNAFDVMSRGLMFTTQLFTEPIVGSGGWQAYFVKSILLNKIFSDIILKVQDAQIVFTPDEPGIIFQDKIQ